MANIVSGVPDGYPFTPATLPIQGNLMWLAADDIADGNVTGSWTSRGVRGQNSQGVATASGTPTKANGRVSYRSGAAHTLPYMTNHFVDYRWMLIVFGWTVTTGTGTSYLMYVNGANRGAATQCQPLVQFVRETGVVNIEHNNNIAINGANRATAATNLPTDGKLHFMLVRRTEHGMNSRISVDGNAEGLSPAASTTFLPVGANGLAGKIGGDTGLQLDVAHILWGQDELTDDLRDRLQGWAGWEIQRIGDPAVLPSTHPYYATKPTAKRSESPALRRRRITPSSAIGTTFYSSGNYGHQSTLLSSEVDLTKWTQTYNAVWDGSDGSDPTKVIGNEAGLPAKVYAQGLADITANQTNPTLYARNDAEYFAAGPSQTYYPVVTQNGRQCVRLQATRFDSTHWILGSIQTVNRNGYGFSQRGGYFEVEWSFQEVASNTAPGVRIASLWMEGVQRWRDATLPYPECDPNESYAYQLGPPGVYKYNESISSTIHHHGGVWRIPTNSWEPSGDSYRGYGAGLRVTTYGHDPSQPPTTLATTISNLVGRDMRNEFDGTIQSTGVRVDINRGIIIIYHNRVECQRFAMMPEHYDEWYMISGPNITTDTDTNGNRVPDTGPYNFYVYSMRAWADPNTPALVNKYDPSILPS